jgi:GT2 family glycosyltransferase
VLPSELCIVDSSEEATARDRVEELCGAVDLPLDYVHPAPKGLTVQRNVGIDRTHGDPVFFIDDDVMLAPNCHEKVLAEYERWGPELGGVRGQPARPARPPLYAIAWRRLFGIGGWWTEASGKMRPGFFVEGVSESAGVRKLDYFNGWFMSYRREVVEQERFDEALAGYAYKEDIDYSHRVRRRGYVLVQTPAAVIDHLKTSTGRMSPYLLQRMNVANQFYLHRKHMPQTLPYRASLLWGLVGLFTLNIGKAVQQRDHGYITGLVVGAWEQLRGRGLIDPAEEISRRDQR